MTRFASMAGGSTSGADRPRRLWLVGAAILLSIVLACVASLPYTLGQGTDPVDPRQHARVRYDLQALDLNLLPPTWANLSESDQARLETYTEQIRTVSPEGSASTPTFILGTDALGRDFLVRILAGGAISLGIGVSAAAIAVFIGTLWGMIAGYFGGRVDSVMMRIVDVLYGLPYILLVVLLSVGVNGAVLKLEAHELSKQAEAVAAGAAYSAPWWLTLIQEQRGLINVITLFVAIGGVSWLTMARVIRGQVLSLKAQPFMEACRAIDVPLHLQLRRHLLPNLIGPIVVYATLTVPQAILQESFLSFLGIGVPSPLPSWGNLAAEGLAQLNTVHSRWWLLLFPCLLLAVTLMALNFIGEGLREAFDPKRRTVAAM